jgi:tetratricopeptide (TPR) repeat protein
MELGAQIPTLNATPIDGQATLPVSPLTFGCSKVHPDVQAACDTITEAITGLNVPDKARYLRRQRESVAGDAKGLLALAQIYRYELYQPKEYESLLQQARQCDSTLPLVRMALAEKCSDQGEYEEALEWLTPISLGDVPIEVRRHHFHVLAVAHLARGELEQAQSMLERALEYEGSCALDHWLDLAKSSIAESTDAPLSQEISSAACNLIAIIRASEAPMKSGDWEQALKVLDCCEVWFAEEIQSSARLAEAVLNRADTGLSAKARHAWAVAQFCDVHAVAGELRRELFLPLSLRWSRARLIRLADRANAWLENWNQTKANSD